MYKLRQLELQGLFGWGHPISIVNDPNDSVSFLTGRNGSGKTTILHLIKAVADQDWPYLASSNFTELKLCLESSDQEEKIEVFIRSKNSKKIFELKDRDGKMILSKPILVADHSEDIAYLKREGIIWDAYCGRHWASRRSDHMREAEVTRIHEDQLPKRTDELAENEHVTSLNEKFIVHLIETSRLYSSQPRFTEETGLTLNVENVPKKIRSLIRTADGTSAILTDKLLVELFDNSIYNDKKSDRNINDINSLLKSIFEQETLLNRVDTYKLPAAVDESKNINHDGLDTAYLILSSIAERIEPYKLLSEKMNVFKDMFVAVCPNMELEYTRENGIQINDGEIEPCDLSSGQQHQMVMLFDLIFQRKKDELILIDEPEMSMDIEWQQEISDRLERISELNGCHFLLATHSHEVLGLSESSDISARDK